MNRIGVLIVFVVIASVFISNEASKLTGRPLHRNSQHASVKFNHASIHPHGTRHTGAEINHFSHHTHQTHHAESKPHHTSHHKLGQRDLEEVSIDDFPSKSLHNNCKLISSF